MPSPSKNEKIKLCCIFNKTSSYRVSIYSKIDNEFDCKFIFGTNKSLVNYSKLIDLSTLKNCKVVQVKAFIKPPFYWQKDVISEIFNDYHRYLVLGEPHCISTWIILLLSKILPNKQIYFWTHGWYGRESFLKKIIKKVFFGLAHKTFVYNNYARDLMIAEGFNPDKIAVIYNSLNYDTQLPLRKESKETDIYKNHFKNDNNTLIFIGRLLPRKKLDMILNSIYLLKKQNKEFNIVFIGNGSVLESLQDKAKQLDIENNVWFYGECYDEKLNAELIYNAGLCISPGDIGLTAIHALMFGCPCLIHSNFSNQCPEFETIKEGQTGIFFEENNINSMAKAIEKWFDSAQDRQTIRENCYAEIDSKWHPANQIEILKSNIENEYK